MQKKLSRRRFLRDTALGAAVGFGAHALGARDVEARTTGPQIVGTGRIQQNLEGVTIPSPSDFGFSASAEGGAFVCSMYGNFIGQTGLGLGAPGTGGFKGCNIMTVQGLVVPNTLQIHRGTASFSIKVGIFASPDVFTGSGDLILNIGAVDGTIQVKLGGPHKATMVMHIPDVTAAVGGDTGGILEFGRIERRRIVA